MGRHLAVEEAPPPKDKPRYRFLVAVSGILVLACVAMAVVNAVFPEQSQQAAAGPDETGIGGNPFPDVPGDPGVSGTTPDPSISGPGAGPSVTAPTIGASGVPAPPVPPLGPVTGDYALLSTYPNIGFQAQVSLTNGGSDAQSWQVRLRYPDNVTGYVSVWIDSYPDQPLPPAVDQGDFIFSGSAPLAPGETIALRFHMNATGASIAPAGCWVNGRPCS